MSNVSSSNSQEVRVPKLRFPGFEGEYRVTTLGSIADKIVRNDPKSDAPVMMISAASGFINQSEKYSRENAGQSLKKYTLLKQGELAYNHGASKLRQFGCCFELKEKAARIPYVYHTFSIKEKEYAPYIAILLNNPIMDKQLKRLVSSSVRMDGLLNISYDEYMSIKVPIPTQQAEQRKVLAFIEKIEQRIEKQRQLVESLKSYKRGLSEAIFSRKLHLICNTNIQWEKHKFGTLGYFYNGLSGKSKDDFGCGNAEFITYMNVYKNTIADEQVLEYVNVPLGEKQNAVQYGDILFTQSSETLEEVGYSSVWLSSKAPYLNSFCFGFRFNTSSMIDPYFIAYYFRSSAIRNAIMREGQGATRVNLSSERLKDIVVSLPPLTVQKKIGMILNNVQMQINRNSDIIERLCTYKDGLLQSLFI